MIDLYSGTPGSGKSFHATAHIFYRLRNGRNVICNYPVSLDNCSYSFLGFWLKKLFKNFKPRKRKLGSFTYLSNDELTVDFLKKYAKENHKGHKEHETLVVIDECGIKFNPRTFAQSDRLQWIEFFSLHRHYGYDFILISQSDRMVDRQIRSFFEYEHRHRNVGNFKLLGKILALLSGGSLFVDVVYWYGIREKVNSEWIRYSNRISSLYDTFFLMDDVVKDEEQDNVDEPLPDNGVTEGRGGDPLPGNGADNDEPIPSILDNSNT